MTHFVRTPKGTLSFKKNFYKYIFIADNISMYIMCVILCLFSALSLRVGTLQISIIIIIIINNPQWHRPWHTHQMQCRLSACLRPSAASQDCIPWRHGFLEARMHKVSTPRMTATLRKSDHWFVFTHLVLLMGHNHQWPHWKFELRLVLRVHVCMCVWCVCCTSIVIMYNCILF